MKDLTWDAVLAVVKDLVPTTTLDVKNALRQLGYYATQIDVSSAMQTLVQQGELECYLAPDWANNSKIPYNIYKLPQAQSSYGYTSQPTTPTGNNLTIDDVKPVTKPSSGDWLLFGYSGGMQLAVDGQVDRNVARAWYERETGTPYALVGCNRVR